jgi:hypothetical protein
MMRILLAFGLAVAIGCKGVEPIGPFAKMKGNPTPKAKPKKELDSPPPPVAVPAVKPTPPMNLIDPYEVSPENPQAAIQRLRNELEADQRVFRPRR